MQNIFVINCDKYNQICIFYIDVNNNVILNINKITRCHCVKMSTEIIHNYNNEIMQISDKSICYLNKKQYISLLTKNKDFLNNQIIKIMLNDVNDNNLHNEKEKVNIRELYNEIIKQ